VPLAVRPLQWLCECQAQNDSCVHVRGLVMLVCGLPRPESAGLPKPCTYLQNAWKRPSAGVAYNINTPFGELPIEARNITADKAHEAAGTTKRKTATQLPIAATQLWDPQVIGAACPVHRRPAC
jgi:hypothetical protein